MATPHVPVMVAEVSAAFGAMAIPLRRLIDCTLGAAGHTTALVTPTPRPSVPSRGAAAGRWLLRAG